MQIVAELRFQKIKKIKYERLSITESEVFGRFLEFCLKVKGHPKFRNVFIFSEIENRINEAWGIVDLISLKRTPC